MTKVITFGIQKGGSAKTTTSGVVAHLLSQNHRVLAVDLDSQGNLTELITQQDIYDFHGHTVLEALKEQNAEPYINRWSDNLHLLTADDLLATFSRWLYLDYTGEPAMVLRDTLESVKHNYDYIVLDTPPALGDITINALSASDAVVALFEPSRFCYSALQRFIETVVHVQDQVNGDLQLAGILVTMLDKRRSDARALLEILREDHEEKVFNTVITRRAATGRLGIEGFRNNPELKNAVMPYTTLIEELLQRV